MSQLWERQPIADSPLSVIVLTDNLDVDALRETLTSLKSVLSKRNKAYEVLVPVPASVDRVLQPVLSACEGTRLICDEDVRQGQGAALKVGIQSAQYPLVFVLPEGYSPSHLPDFLNEINQVDIVCGARDGKQKGWQRRQFFSVAYQIFGIWMQDPECAMRLYRREIFDKLPIQSKGAFAQIEILAKANFQSRLMTDIVIQGPATQAVHHKKDFWKVMNHPDFGQPPDKVVEVIHKPIISTQAPEVRAHDIDRQ